MSEYNSLVKTGAIGSYKRDVLLEAADDLWYLCHILAYFTEEAGVPENEAHQSTLRLARELMDVGLVQIATWGEQGNHNVVTMSDDELIQAIKRLDKNPFKWFLIATDAGLDWVKRYKELIGELFPDGLKRDQV